MTELLQALANGIIAGATIALPAVGLSMMYAVLRFPNFAVAGVASVGAYLAYIANVRWGLAPLATVPVAFVGAGLVGLACDWVGMRRLRRVPSSDGGLTVAIVSIAIMLALESILRFVFGNDLRSFDVPIMRDVTLAGIRVNPQQFGNLGIAVAVTACLFLYFRYTRMGKAMRAVADNPTLARLKGIDPAVIAALTIFLGMGLAGVGGALLGIDTSIDPLTGSRFLLTFFAASVLGGLSSPAGAVIGAVAIGVAEEVALIWLPPTYRSAVGFVAIFLFLTFRPQGLMGRR
ncbi:MAG TPA: branched-chain amino acid ABC transporter permease [Bordetella sp.]|nr:branched-chain amino acid ABC transporter permease [Bordetella sp.]